MQVDDVLHNVQAETRAGLIHRARTVGLVEAVEHMWQILRRNADAGVADGEYAQLSLLMDLQPQRTAVLDELYRVIGQVVHHAVQVVAVTHDGQPFLEVALHIQLLFLNLLLEREQDLRRHFGKVERRRTEDQLAGLNFCGIQHAVYHAGQTFGLLRDDLQILVALVERNRAVDHAVHKAADGRHRGLELVADVGNKAAGQLLELVKVARHVVERDRQLVNLVAAVVLGHTHIEVAARKFLGGGGNRLERTRDVLRDHERNHQHNDQRHQHDEHERLRGVAHHACRIRVLRGDEDHQIRIAVIILDAGAHRVKRGLTQHAERPDRRITAVFVHLRNHFS